MFSPRLAYGVMMLTAACVAGILIARQQRSLRLKRTDRWTVLAGGFIGATFAARLPFVIYGIADTSSGYAWLGDGKTILWGLAGGYVGVEIGKWIAGVKARTGDTFVVGIAMAIAIGRLGCFFYGCCHGIPTNLPWGMCFAVSDDGGTVPRHPTQLYELLFHASFASIASYGLAHGWLRGDWMAVYLMTYCVYRFFSEYLRPEPIIAAGQTMYQWSAIVIFLCMGYVLTSRRRGLIHADTAPRTSL